MIKKKMARLANDHLLILIILSLVTIGTMLSPTFLRVSNLQNLLFSITVLGFLALGESLVMLVAEIDLTLGAIIAFAPTAGVWLARKILLFRGSDIVQGGQYVTGGLGLSVLFTILVGVLISLLMGFIITRFNIIALIATLGGMYALGGCVFLFFNGYSLYFNNLPGTNWLGTAKMAGVPISFILFLSVGLIIMFFMKYTKFGRRIYATGGNEKAAIYAGINIKKWKIIAFAINGFLASIAALIYTSRLESIEMTQGSGYEMYAIAIALIAGISMEGGRGTVGDVILASIIIGLSFNVMTLLGLFSWWQTMTIGSIILFAAAQLALSRKSLVKKMNTAG
ncbi:MAG TPA: ABC transporter permease [Nitrospirota bacterium]|nr:ABC transporter permease [Nitrospirota bacterium]